MNNMVIDLRNRIKITKKVIQTINQFSGSIVNSFLLNEYEFAIYAELQKIIKGLDVSVNSLEITKKAKESGFFNEYESFFIIKVSFELLSIELKNALIFFFNNMTGEVKYSWFSKEPDLLDIKKMVEVKDED